MLVLRTRIQTDSADIAWRNGVWVANGNLAIRHLGIPTVTVPMGTMADIHMPVGLTFAGRAYSDTALLHLPAHLKQPAPIELHRRGHHENSHLPDDLS